MFGDFSVDKVVSYTATLIRDSGSGLEKIFHDLLRSQGTVFRRAEELECHEGGGLTARAALTDTAALDSTVFFVKL